MTSLNDDMVLSITHKTNEFREHEETASTSMSFMDQRYDLSGRARPPCARGDTPPQSLQDIDDPRLEMARKIEAIARAVAEKQQHNHNPKACTSFLLQQIPAHME